MRLPGTSHERRVKSDKDWPTEKCLRIFNSRRLDTMIWVTAHCIERYRERFRATYSLREAKVELERRMRTEGEFTIDPPSWLGPTPNKTAIGYVRIDDEIALPILDNHTPTKRFVAATCLYRVQ